MDRKSGDRLLKGVLLSGLLLALLLSAGCVRKPEDVLVRSKSKEIVASRLDEKVLMLATENYIPYSFEENGEVRGIGVELVREGLRRLGYTAELSVLPWTRALQMTQDGDVDGIFCAFYSEDRAVYLKYMEEPLAYEAQMLYALPGNPVAFDGTMASLKPYRIGILQDYYYGEAFEAAVEAGELKVERVTDIPTNIHKLLEGRIDVMVDHRYSMGYYLKRLGVTDEIAELPVPFREPAPLYLAFTKKRFIDRSLIEALDQAIRDMKKDGTYEEIVDSYLR